MYTHSATMNGKIDLTLLHTTHQQFSFSTYYTRARKPTDEWRIHIPRFFKKWFGLNWHADKCSCTLTYRNTLITPACDLYAVFAGAFAQQVWCDGNTAVAQRRSRRRVSTSSLGRKYIVYHHYCCLCVCDATIFECSFVKVTRAILIFEITLEHGTHVAGN